MAQGWQDDVVVAKIKKTILGRGGANAFQSTVRNFRAMDTNDDNCLDPREFSRGIRNLGVKITDAELNYLFKVFDKNKDGTVSVDEFIKELIGGLNPRRKKVVDHAYSKFDVTGDGLVTLADLTGTFDASKNPLVLKGEKTEDEIKRDFLATFEGANTTDGKVTKEEFYTYYAGLSASIPHDDYFEAMVLKAWDIDPNAKPRLDATQRDWSATNGDPLDYRPDIRADKLNHTLGTSTKSYSADHMRRQEPKFVPNPSVLPDYITTQRRDFPEYNGEQIRKSDPTRSNEPPVFSPTGNAVVDGVRKKILSRAGPEGFHGLARVFRIIDKNRNQRLSKEEIDNGLKRYGIKLTPVELSGLISFLDRDGSGIIDTTEFYRCVRGPITQQSRLAILKLAFDRLDVDGSQILTMEEVALKYDASGHPQVKSGQKSEETIRREFIADWDRDGNAQITWEEWLEYYANISCVIDDDQYFELMIRNAWHISGGTGAAANTSCRRVLVIYQDDSQKVVEIKNDLGLRADDIEGMKRRLIQQGEKNIKKIELSS